MRAMGSKDNERGEWNDLATVDEKEVTNLPAKRFYESLGFTAIPPPLEAEARLRFYNRARTYYAPVFANCNELVAPRS